MKEYIEREPTLFNLRNHYPKPDDMIASVVTIPAADVAPVRHGWWRLAIENRNRFTCSVCGWSKRTDSHVSLGYLGYNYCPNCGARMDGGVNDAAN